MTFITILQNFFFFIFRIPRWIILVTVDSNISSWNLRSRAADIIVKIRNLKLIGDKWEIFSPWKQIKVFFLFNPTCNPGNCIHHETMKIRTFHRQWLCDTSKNDLCFFNSNVSIFKSWINVFIFSTGYLFKLYHVFQRIQFIHISFLWE